MTATDTFFDLSRLCPLRALVDQLVSRRAAGRPESRRT